MSISSLPFEILCEVFQYLNLKQLSEVRAANRTCYIVADQVAGNRLRKSVLKRARHCFIQVHRGSRNKSKEQIVASREYSLDLATIFHKDKQFEIDIWEDSLWKYEHGEFPTSGCGQRPWAWDGEDRERRVPVVPEKYEELDRLLESCFLTIMFDCRVDDREQCNDDEQCEKCTKLGIGSLCGKRYLFNRSARLVYGLPHRAETGPPYLGTEFGIEGKTDDDEITFTQKMVLKTFKYNFDKPPFPLQWIRNARLREEIIVQIKVKYEHPTFTVVIGRNPDVGKISCRNLVSLDATFIDSAEGGENYHPFLGR
jgi:hypothetical protein